MRSLVRSLILAEQRGRGRCGSTIPLISGQLMTPRSLLYSANGPRRSGGYGDAREEAAADRLYAGVDEVRRKIAEVPTTGAIGLAEVSVTWNFCPRRQSGRIRGRCRARGTSHSSAVRK